MGRCSHQQFFSPISTTIILPWILQMILLAFWWNTSACMPARQRTVLKWNLFTENHRGKSHFWFDKKTGAETEGEGFILQCCGAMLKTQRKTTSSACREEFGQFQLTTNITFWTTHQMPDILSWIFNLSKKSANQHQKHNDETVDSNQFN